LLKLQGGDVQFVVSKRFRTASEHSVELPVPLK
jgi:hypothetical protein